MTERPSTSPVERPSADSGTPPEVGAARNMGGYVDDLRIERECPRCRYRIYPGFFHEEMKQPEGSNVVVCSLRRAPAGLILRGPLVDVLDRYLGEAKGKS